MGGNKHVKKNQDYSAFQCLHAFMVKGAHIYFLGLLCSFFALLCSFFTVEIFTGLVRLDLFPSAFRFRLNWLIKEMANIFKERFFLSIFATQFCLFSFHRPISSDHSGKESGKEIIRSDRHGCERDRCNVSASQAGRFYPAT